MRDRENMSSNKKPGKITCRCKCEFCAEETKDTALHLKDRIRITENRWSYGYPCLSVIRETETSFIQKSDSFEYWENVSVTPWGFEDIIIKLMFLVRICGKWKLHWKVLLILRVSAFLEVNRRIYLSENKLLKAFLFVLT